MPVSRFFREHLPPQSVAARIHAIVATVLDHSNPALPEIIHQDREILWEQLLLHSLTVATDVLLFRSQANAVSVILDEAFSAIFGGDQLAAKFLKYALIANMYA